MAQMADIHPDDGVYTWQNEEKGIRMVKYDVVKFEEILADIEEVTPGCTIFRPDGDPYKIVESCGTLSVAKEKLKNYSARVVQSDGYFHVHEFCILKHEYDKDGNDVTFAEENLGDNLIPEDWMEE